jgi:two-component sensor histidine kinase
MPRRGLRDQRFLKMDADVSDGLRLGGVGVWRWKIDSDELHWSDNLEAVHALPAGSFDGTLTSFQRDLHPDDVEPVWSNIRQTLDTGAPYRAVYRSAHTPERCIEAAGGITEAPDGTRFLTGVCFDVTSRVRKEQELARRLRQQQVVTELGTYAIAEANFNKVLTRAVETAAEAFDVPLAKVLQLDDAADQLLLVAGVGWTHGLVGRAMVGIEQESQAGYTLLKTEPVVVEDLRTETRFSGPQLLHDHRVRSGMSVVIAGVEQRPFGVFGVHTPEARTFDGFDAGLLVSIANIVANAARHHRAAERQKLLMREMAHRSGNLMQVVTSIARQTFRPESDRLASLSAFSARLELLSRANYAVARGGWSTIRFRTIVSEALGPMIERFDLAGRDIVLPAELAFDLSLVLHELATNSFKYGALSRSIGTVAVSWQLRRSEPSGRVLRIEWRDPTPSSWTPEQGARFGSTLQQLLVEKKWKGRMEVDSSNGYRWVGTIPLPAR